MPIQEFDFTSGKTVDPKRNQAVSTVLDEADASLLKNALRARNYQFAGEAKDLRSLLALVRKLKIGVLFLDTDLQGLDIGELMPSLKKAFPDFKVVVVSDAFTKELLQEAKELGAVGFLARPLTEEAIVNLYARLK